MEKINGAATRVAVQLVKDDVKKLVAKPWSRKGDSPLRRSGTCKGRIFLEGEPVPIERVRGTRPTHLSDEVEQKRQAIVASLTGI